MTGLKILVGVMTFCIVAMIVLIAYGLYQKSLNPNYRMFGSDATAVSSPSEPSQTSVTGFGEISLDLPATARIVSTQTDGTRLVLVIARDGQNADLAAVIDLNSGKVLGRVKTAR